MPSNIQPTPLTFGKPTGDPVYLDDLKQFVDSNTATPGPTNGTAYMGVPFDHSAESGKWSLGEGYYGPRNGQLIYASEKVEATPLSFASGVSGYHAIHVVGYSPKARHTGIYVKLDNEEHWTLLKLQRSEATIESMFYKIADLTDRKIEVANFNHDVCLDHVCLLPVEGPADLPEKKGQLVGMLDFPDDAGRSKPIDKAAASSVQRHHDMDYDIVLWKAYAVRCEYHTKNPEAEIRDVTSLEDTLVDTDHLAGSSIGIGDLLSSYDTMRQAVDHAKKIGQKIFGWARINNEFSKLNHQFSATTPFHKDNPDAVQRHRDGQRTTKLSFAYPEVRKHKIDILCEIASYGMDGIFLDVLRHPPMALFDQPIVDSFIEKTGRDPREMPNDGDVDWLRHRAEYFTQFCREAKAALRESQGRDVPLWIRTLDRPNQNLLAGCDVDQWLDEELFDGILFGPHCAMAEDYPDHIDLTSYLSRRKPSTKILGVVWRYGSALHAEVLAKQLYDQGVDGIAIYESNAAVAQDSTRNIMHKLSRPELLCQW